MPLQDIIIGGKNHTDYTFVNGEKQFNAISAVNQDGDKQDVNQKAGGDYIYLLKVKEVQLSTNPNANANPHMVASILGSGSVVVICIFIIAAVGLGWFMVYKKKHQTVADDTNADES